MEMLTRVACVRAFAAVAMIGSQQSTVPKGLPNLPGNGFKDPTVMSFKKSHVFDVHQGIPVAHDPSVVSAPGAMAAAVEPPVMPPMPTADITPVQPAWVAFDRKVLRFNCYFKEVCARRRARPIRARPRPMPNAWRHTPGLCPVPSSVAMFPRGAHSANEIRETRAQR